MAQLLKVLAALAFLASGISMAGLQSAAGNTVAEAFYNYLGWAIIGLALLVFATLAPTRQGKADTTTSPE